MLGEVKNALERYGKYWEILGEGKMTMGKTERE